MEKLDFENIMSSSDIENLFADSFDDVEDNVKDKTSDDTEVQTDETDIKTTEINTDNLFEESESVGSEDEDNQDSEEDTDSSSKKGSSPKSNFYSSIAKALQEEGIFPDLDIDNIGSPEDFAHVVEQTIQSKLDERQKRIDDALNAGLPESDIKKYENTLGYLDSLKKESIRVENEQGENLRKQLIYQDYINRGYSPERAQREVTKSLNAGTDIEDAFDALDGNREFFKSQYDAKIKELNDERDRETEERKKQGEALKKSILEDKKVFGEIQLDKQTRQKVFDNITKPVYQDKDTGEYYTPLQKYEMENKTEFMKNLGLLFTLTDGFTNLEKLVKGKVKREVGSKLRDLENTLNNTSRTSDGNLKFVGGIDEDSDSYIGKGWDLDI